jgi:hypothetical protein
VGPVLAPRLSVVIAPGDNPLRLRWLLNALAEQKLDGSLWEVVVVHDREDPETPEVLSGHPLASRTVLATAGGPFPTVGARLNAGWQAARAPHVVFTSTDCRPPAEWLDRVLAAVQAYPQAILVGPVEGDPDDEAMRHAAYWETMSGGSNGALDERAGNVVYPRTILDRWGGFPGDIPLGEHAALTLRARSADAPWRHAEEMLTYSALRDSSLAKRLSEAVRLRGVPLAVARHPELRSSLAGRLFWSRSHAFVPLALVGIALSRRIPLSVLLVLPWAVQIEPLRSGPRGHVRHLLELPGWAAIDAAQMSQLVLASMRHRSLVL